MGEGIKDYVGDFYADTEEIDEDYEFDACKFFDFTKMESDSEIQEAERWFEFTGEYPPSPFVVILNSENLLSLELLSDSTKSTCRTNMNSSISCGSESNIKNVVLTSKGNAKGKCCKSTAKTKLKSADQLYQPKSYTLLKPTLSHLLKQQKVHDTHSSQLCSRFRRITNKSDLEGLNNAIGIDNIDEVKRQKLESGYLKVAKLKHQFSLLHKSSKTKKLTVPREPELQTLLRAQDRKANGGSASSGSIDKQKQKGCSFSLHQLNKKFFHLKNKDRANHYASAKVHPSAKDVDSSEARSQKATMSKDFGLTRNNELIEGPPVAQFSELSLGMGSLSKSEDASVKKHNLKWDRCGGNSNIRTNKIKCWPNMKGSVSIH